MSAPTIDPTPQAPTSAPEFLLKLTETFPEAKPMIEEAARKEAAPASAPTTPEQEKKKEELQKVADGGKDEKKTTASGDPEKPPKNEKKDGLDEASEKVGKTAGLFANVAAVGVALQAVRGAFGGGGGFAGVNYASPTGSVSVGTGPFGGVAGINSFGGGFGVGGGGFGGGAFAGMDFSNTGFSIGFNAMNNRDKARALDVILNMLLASIMSGNIDAITTALTMVNLKSKTTLIEASVHMIQAMRYYDDQTKKTSDKIAALAGKPSQDGGATLAGFNAEMNGYSMTRQAITNGIRDIMTMVEELSNAEQGFRTKREHLISSSTRWA